jgi:hypothetical protein
MSVIITIHQFYDIQYRCEDYVFWRQIDPSRNDSDIEVRQAVPNRRIKQILLGIQPI